MRAVQVVRGRDGQPAGVVLVSDYLGGDLARNSRRIVDAYEGYQQLRVLKRPLAGVYLSFFVMMTLLVLVSATWVGPVPRQAHHPPRAVARGRGAGDRGGAPRPPHRAGDA